MTSDRRVALIVSSGHTAKLSLDLAMNTARFSETESDVQKREALRCIASMRAELVELEAALNGVALPVPTPPKLIAAE